MIVTQGKHTIDSLAISTADHLLTALAQIGLYGQPELEWLLEWSDRMIRETRDEHIRPVLEAFNTCVAMHMGDL